VNDKSKDKANSEHTMHTRTYTHTYSERVEGVSECGNDGPPA
jgi:hypothetical protein